MGLDPSHIVYKHGLYSTSKVYDQISSQMRGEVVRLVIEEKKMLKEAAKILKINYSTAKTIMRIYRKENRISRKSDQPAKIFNIKKVAKKSLSFTVLGKNPNISTTNSFVTHKNSNINIDKNIDRSFTGNLGNNSRFNSNLISNPSNQDLNVTQRDSLILNNNQIKNNSLSFTTNTSQVLRQSNRSTKSKIKSSKSNYLDFNQKDIISVNNNNKNEKNNNIIDMNHRNLAYIKPTQDPEIDNLNLINRNLSQPLENEYNIENLENQLNHESYPMIIIREIEALTSIRNALIDQITQNSNFISDILSILDLIQRGFRSFNQIAFNSQFQ